MSKVYVCALCGRKKESTHARLPERWLSYRDNPVCPNHSAKEKCRYRAILNRQAQARQVVA